jgi:acyl-CoA synthetase (AMP-forming)/AMP-acid ligase II
MAVCVPNEGADVQPDSLLAWLAPQVASYKLPRHAVLWDALPKSAYGKITKNIIREALAARGQLPAPDK